MDVKIIPVVFLLLIYSQSFAKGLRGVPEKLFGIALGGIYDVGNPEVNDLGNIPVKKFTGMKRILGNGIHYYFQPKAEYKLFEYVEKRKKQEDQYFETSFRLYLLPVIPSTITTAEQLDLSKLKWEVTLIEWSNDPPTKEEGYYWAIEQNR